MRSILKFQLNPATTTDLTTRAQLNYAVLESRVRFDIVAHGYDPMIGHLHSYDRAALVFDLMEPLRLVADRVVLYLVRCQTYEPSDFTIKV